MSRYRPPRPPSAKYITAEGEKAMKAELHQLWKVERPVITQSVSEAAAQGDRSENAEQIYGKKRLREIDSIVS
jgi:transcription elongation factor GreB